MRDAYKTKWPTPCADRTESGDAELKGCTSEVGCTLRRRQRTDSVLRTTTPKTPVLGAPPAHPCQGLWRSVASLAREGPRDPRALLNAKASYRTREFCAAPGPQVGCTNCFRTQLHLSALLDLSSSEASEARFPAARRANRCTGIVPAATAARKLSGPRRRAARPISSKAAPREPERSREASADDWRSVGPRDSGRKRGSRSLKVGHDGRERAPGFQTAQLRLRLRREAEIQPILAAGGGELSWAHRHSRSAS
eukprot:scaffold1617_cov252-Pinguiococcus_pyrenoidosus.AAC.2